MSENLKHDLKLLSAETEDVPDLFYVAFMQDKAKADPNALENFSLHVSKYIKGFWCDIMQEGLHRRLCEDKAKANIGKAASDLFDDILP